MPIPDFPDWTTPVHEIESVTQLTAADLPIASGASSPVIDTSGAASLAMLVKGSTLTVGTRLVIQLLWVEGNAIVALETITLNTPASWAVNATYLKGTRAVRGSSLVVRAFTNDGSSALVTLWGSTRVVDGPILSTDSVQQGRSQLSSGNTAVGAGATVSVGFLPPVTRAVSLRLSGLTATTPSLVRLLLNAVVLNGGAATIIRMGEIPYAAAAQNINPYPVPGYGLEVGIINSDTAARTVSADLFDVS